MATGLAMAQYLPNPGTLNMEMDPAGVSSFEVQSPLCVPNRECTDVATLSVNGEVKAKVSASNYELVYCISGMDKLIDGPASLHITFFNGKMDDSPFKYDGEYTVYIPAGFFFQNSEANEPITANYTIKGNPRLEINPVNGEKVSSIDRVEISFPDAVALVYNKASNYKDDNALYCDFVPSGTENITYSAPLEVKIEGNKAIVLFDKNYTENGLLTLYGGVGAFTYTAADGKTYSSPLIQNKYKVRTSQVSANVSISPEPGEYEDFTSVQAPTTYTTNNFTGEVTENKWYSFFKLTFNGDFESVQATKQYPYICPVVDGVPDTKQAVKFNMIVDDKAIYLYSTQYKFWKAESSLNLDPGEYKLVFPAGAYTLNRTEQSSEFSFDYTVVPSQGGVVTVPYTLFPSNTETVEALQQIKVTFDGAEKVEWNKADYIHYSCDGVEYVARVEVDPAASNVLLINIHSKSVLTGKVDFYSNTGALSVDGKPVRLTFSYNFKNGESAVEGVEAADAEKVIYTIDGYRVNEENLKPGLYIVNGKKVIVK